MYKVAFVGTDAGENTTWYELLHEPSISADRVQISINEAEPLDDIVEAMKSGEITVKFFDDENNGMPEDLRYLKSFSGLTYLALSCVAGSGCHSIEYLRSTELEDIMNRVQAAENTIEDIRYSVSNPLEIFVTPCQGTITTVRDERIKVGMAVLSVTDDKTDAAVDVKIEVIDGALVVSEPPHDGMVLRVLLI